MTPKMAPFRFNGAVAVVTGAAGAMGEQLAYGLALRGTHLVLVDRHAERLTTVAATVTRRRPETRVRTFVADLSAAAAAVGKLDAGDGGRLRRPGSPDARLAAPAA